MMRCLTIIVLLSAFSLPAKAQDDAKNKGNAIIFQISYAFQYPSLMLKNRYGNNNNVGIGMEYILDKSNIILGWQSGYLFGQTVKTDVIAGLRTAEGLIIGNDRGIADIQLYQRGYYVGAMVGKLFPMSTKEPRSGLRITLGSGLLQHKIRIQDDPQRPVGALSGDYKKGYDRLSNGLAFNGFMGYQVLSKDGLINFYLGLEAIYGNTRNRREINIDTGVKDTQTYQDMLIGIRAGWMLPFYVGARSREIFY
jgi:hypothetical protein